MGFAEVVIEQKGTSISVFGFAELAGVMISEAEVIPGLGVGGNECGGEFEFFYCLGVFAFVDELFALEEGLGAGWSATGCEQKEKENKTKVKQIK